MNESLKVQAIEALKSFKPTGNNDVVNIIETILKCYVEVDIEVNENNCPLDNNPMNQSKEVTFLIEELQSFIDGIKKKK